MSMGMIPMMSSNTKCLQKCKRFLKRHQNMTRFSSFKIKRQQQYGIENSIKVTGNGGNVELCLKYMNGFDKYILSEILTLEMYGIINI